MPAKAIFVFFSNSNSMYLIKFWWEPPSTELQPDSNFRSKNSVQIPTFNFRVNTRDSAGMKWKLMSGQLLETFQIFEKPRSGVASVEARLLRSIGWSSSRSMISNAAVSNAFLFMENEGKKFFGLVNCSSTRDVCYYGCRPNDARANVATLKKGKGVHT